MKKGFRCCDSCGEAHKYEDMTLGDECDEWLCMDCAPEHDEDPHAIAAVQAVIDADLEVAAEYEIANEIERLK
jgi:hypothetical protein